VRRNKGAFSWPKFRSASLSPLETCPSLTENTPPASPTDDNLSSLSENTQPVPVPADNLSSLVENTQSALSSPDASPTRRWSDLVQMSWQFAMLPAVTWSSFYTASWKAWESAVQPQWPTR
jgi:hypothetical protein